MIQKGSSSIPHPVLGIDGDMSGSFSVQCSLRIHRDTRQLSIECLYDVSNGYIKHLVGNGDADIIINVRCPSTMRSWSHPCSASSLLTIEEHQVSDYIEFEAIIIAKRDMTNYADESFNDLFSNRQFQILEGDIIGLAGSKRVELPRTNENTAMMSMFRFQDVSHGQSVSVDVSGDEIVIRYPQEGDGSSSLKSMFKKAPWNAFHVFLMPALEAALVDIRDNRNDAETKAWFGVLANLIGAEGLEYDDCFVGAQTVAKSLLDGVNPMHKAAEELKKI